ncbi:transcriptional regulator [Streptomyces asoensis]|uniref:transcriptional regulator n=1 Tax=Streptomyces asoensis TaxID=249586 RepID=UPI0033CDF780
MSTDDGTAEVTEFAALLTELKGRTERSYGSLARRLGMNTSTLHRYCAGEAVPQDFAPVERLARFCGAGPEERLELHRRWLRAAAARRRPPAAATPSDPSGRPAPGEAPRTPQAPDSRQAPEPQDPGEIQEPGETQGARDVQGAREIQEAGKPQEPGVAPEAGKPQEPGVAPEVGKTRKAGKPQEPGVAPEVGKTQEAGETQELGKTQEAGEIREPGEIQGAREIQGAGEIQEASQSRQPGETREAAGPRGIPGQRPRRRWPRRRTQVAVAVTCAVLATLGTLSALPGGGHPSASDDVVGAPTPSAGTSDPTRTTAGRLHGSPSPRTPTATATGPGTTGSAAARPHGSSPASGASPDGGTAPAPASGVPLAYTVDSQVWALGCDHDYVIDRQPAQVPPPPAQQDAAPWASAQGAVHGRETDVEISVQGRTSTAVVLTALRVRVVGRAAPLPGVVYAMDQGCGGDLTKRYFAVDLDRDRPVARAVAGNDAGTPIPAVSLPYRVSSTDPEVLLVTARTETCACDWYLELDWSSQGRTGTVRVDDHGRPFRTSGTEGLPRYWYGNVDGERRWVPTG